MATQRSNLSRRTFLDILSQVGGASAVYGAMTAMGLSPVPKAYAGPPDLPAQSGRGTRVLILGAGIAGLVAALELRKAGYTVTLLEARDRPGGRVFTVRAGTVIEESDSRQVATWDRGPDLFFDAGAARLPQHHQGILEYARQFEVPMELMNNENRAAFLQHSKAFGGAPQRSRQVAADIRGFVAELAAKVVDQASLDHPVTTEDKEKLTAFLRAFGGLDAQLRYRGSDRAGYSALPAAGTTAGRHLDPLDINHLLKADFWSALYAMCEGPTQGAAMLRPVGGMANIANAMARSLGGLIRYNTVVTRIQRRGDGARIQWKDANTKQTGAIDAPYVLVTIQPHLLTTIDNDLSPRVRQALSAPTMAPLAKVAFQAERRFWELDDNIYGGISWTDHPITQIWYPSQGIHGKKGILVGAYVFANGETFAQKTPDERLEQALEGGERMHKDYRRYVGNGVSISWLKAKYSYGAVTHWSDDARLNEYPILQSPDGPYHFAGEYLSYINGWQEGALRSAHVAIEQIANRVREKKT